MPGHLGVADSSDRYLYVWDNPLNRYDLNGRDVCGLGVCVGETAEDVGNAIGGAAEGVAGVAERNWEREWGNVERNAEFVAGAAAGVATVASRTWEAGIRSNEQQTEFIGGRAQDFWKNYGSAAESVYRFAGENWETCGEGAAPGGAIGFWVGTAVFPIIGSGAGAAGGAIVGCAGLVGASIGIESQTE